MRVRMVEASRRPPSALFRRAWHDKDDPQALSRGIFRLLDNLYATVTCLLLAVTIGVVLLGILVYEVT